MPWEVIQLADQGNYLLFFLIEQDARVISFLVLAQMNLKNEAMDKMLQVRSAETLLQAEETLLYADAISKIIILDPTPKTLSLLAKKGGFYLLCLMAL